MRWIDTVASYLPSLIVSHLINRTTNEELPSRQEYDTVCLFADVSGFTTLSEAMMVSSEGVEGLARHLNSYFGQMVRIIASEGGDVFKFAGDALIVLWPPPARDSLKDISKMGREGETGELEGTTPMERRVRRAAQCAFGIQEELHNCELAEEVRLSVKIGIGMGKVSVLHLGGVYKRMEYIAVGEPLLEAFTAEHHATPGDVIISELAHKLVKGHFTTTEVFADGYCRVTKEQRYTPMRKQNKVNMLQQSLDDPLLEVKVKGYIPGAVLRNLRPDSPEDEHWSNEIRRVTVLFVNLGLKEQTLLAAAVYDEAMEEMHRVMVAVQESVYEYEGSINKFLMDDKGSTLVAVYGLPPVGHADDPTRGVLAALRLCERLFDLAKVGSVGITTGEAFCGVVGSKTRKEYTVLGDSVNLAARLMQRATSEDGGVMCELATKRACGGLLQFKARGDFRIKGKTAAAKVFQPYPEDFPKPKPPQYLGANMYGLIHNQQRQNYAMHKLLTSLQAYFARQTVKEAKDNAYSAPASGMSSPGSEQPGRRPLSGSGPTYSGTARPSMSDDHRYYSEDEEERRQVQVQSNTLLGGGSDGGSEEDRPIGDLSDEDEIDMLNHHVELQDPPTYTTDAMRLPFRTGKLPLDMPMPIDDQYDALDQSAAAAATTTVTAGGGGGGSAGSSSGRLRTVSGRRSRPAILPDSRPPADFETIETQSSRPFRKRSFDQSSTSLRAGGIEVAAAEAAAEAGVGAGAGAGGGGARALEPVVIPDDDGLDSPTVRPPGVLRLEFVGKSKGSREFFPQGERRGMRGVGGGVAGGGVGGGDGGSSGGGGGDSAPPSQGRTGGEGGAAVVEPDASGASQAGPEAEIAAALGERGAGAAWAAADAGAAAAAGGGGGGGAAGVAGVTVGAAVAPPGQERVFECEPIKKSSSVAARVFADRRGSGAKSSAASPVSPAYSGGFGQTSSDLVSPNSTTTDSQPMRGGMGRRRNDSHLQKIFNRTSGEGSASGGAGGDSSSQPPSPAASKNSSRGGGAGSTVGSSSHWVSSSAAAASLRESRPGSASSAPPTVSSAASLLLAPPSSSSTNFGGRGGGGLSRGPGSLVGANGAASVMPKSVIERVGDGGGGGYGGGGSGGGGGAGGASPAVGGGWLPGRRGRQGADLGGGSKQGRIGFGQGGRPLSMGSSFTGLGLGEGEERRDGAGAGDAAGGGVSQRGGYGMGGDSKEPMSPMTPMSNRNSFIRTVSGNVTADDDAIFSARAVGKKRRSSRRLSIAQNGMVPLPSANGIPNSELSSSGTYSLTRSSRYSAQHSGVVSSNPGFSSSVQAAFQGQKDRNSSANGYPYQNASLGIAQAFPPPAGHPGVAGMTGVTPALGAPFSSGGPRGSGHRMDDSVSSTTSSNAGGGVRQMVHPQVYPDLYEDLRLHVIVPRSWKWSSLPDHYQRLPAILASEVETFQGLLESCWKCACEDSEVMRWSHAPPALEDLVLNIVGSRVMLPTEPDYDISLLPHFVKEAFGTRGFRGFTDRKRSFLPDTGGGGGGGFVELCLVPKREILNVQSRWLNSRICLLEHKIALVTRQVGSVLLLEGLPGAGKTEVLSVFTARTLPRKALIHFTAASPYHSNKGFGGWSMVLQQYLDSLYKHEVQVSGRDEFSTVRGSNISATEAGRMDNTALPSHKPLGGRDKILLLELEEFPEMKAGAYLVNDVLGTDIPVKGNVSTWDALSNSSSSADGGNGNESDESEFEEGSSVGYEERLKLKILLQLIKNMAKRKPRVVVIDDAQFLDKDSWTLALAVATGGPMGAPLPMMLILSFRPLAHYRAIFASIPPDYEALVQLEHVRFLKIEGAPTEEVERLVAEKLGDNVVDISDSLFGLVEELCTGNPLMITELVSHLKMVEPRLLRYIEIRSEEGDQGGCHNNIDVAVHVSLTDNFRLNGSLLPEKLNALLTSQTDRLNSCQLMALKVASLIGKEFSTWFLYRVYPISGHKDRLLRELTALEEQGFLVEVQGSRATFVIEQEGSGRHMPVRYPSTNDRDPAAYSGNDTCRENINLVYKFTHGFMMEMLQLKMLNNQKSFLRDRIRKLKDSLETQKRHEIFMNLTIDNFQKRKSGMLSVMKYKVTMSQAATNARATTRRRSDSVTSRAMRRVRQPVQQKWTEAVDWKKRKCLLTGESLSLFSDPKDIEPSQIVFLNGATAEAELGEAFKEAAFRVETSKWKKGDEMVDGGERRTFTFLAENKDEKEIWLYQIRHCIEVIEVHARKSGGIMMDRFSRMNSGWSGAADSRASEMTEEVDSTLVVRVEEADDLILEEIFGTTYPYCIVDLDDQGRRTSSIQSASVNPSWKQELTFQVSIQQWILSNLRIQVWNHDLFLTDDFLGQVTIPLKEVPVQEWDQDADTAATDPKWFTLESRCRGKPSSGRLLLGVRLFMNKPTSERAAAVGGVDRLKAVAEKRMDVSSHAARVGQIQQRTQNTPGLGHHVHSANDHHSHHHPGMMPPPIPPGFNRGLSTSSTKADTSIRASIRSMEIELESSGGGGGGGGGGGAARNFGPADPPPLPRYGSCCSSNHSIDVEEDNVGSGPGGEGGGGGQGVPGSRLSGRRRRRSTGSKNRSRRATSETSSCNGIAPDVIHADPLTRQLQLMLLAVETKAKVSMPEESGGGSVRREWIRTKLKELLLMVGRGDIDLDQLETHTYFCKDRKENVYGPFPSKQLVEAHNAGYINDRKVLVQEARMRGEFRPMGARALMHRPSSDEGFKAMTMWPQVDAHHPLADKILSPEDNGSKDFRQWGFDIFGLETQELGLFAATVLADTGLPRVFGIGMKTFAHFMSAVGFFMGRNPRVSYHNLYHAVDVMHATYLTLEGMGASGLLTELEQLALILSALCHDLDHPGLTNSFQTATESPWANLYNDQSPLEHHHLAILFQILRREGCNILGHLEKPQRSRIREVMIQGILATEMSEHATHIKKVDKLLKDYPNTENRIAAWAAGDLCRGPEQSGPYPSSPPLYMETPTSAASAGSSAGVAGRGDGRTASTGPRLMQSASSEADTLGYTDFDRLTVASALLHGADLSSPGRPWATCRVWVVRLLEEFKFQAEQERQRGLRVTVLEGPPSSSQPGFIDAFLIPFFTVLLPIAPGLEDEYLPNLRRNRNTWQSIARRGGSLPPADSLASFSGHKLRDRSNTVNASGSGSGGSGLAGRAGWGRHHSLGGPVEADNGRSVSVTFGSDRRYSGGTIGIASMLGSSGTVRSGRMLDDFMEGSPFDRRVSSVLSGSGTPPDVTSFGNNVAGGMPTRQASAGTGTGSAPSVRGVRYQRSHSARVLSGIRGARGEGGGAAFEAGESWKPRRQAPGGGNDGKEGFKRNDVEALPE